MGFATRVLKVHRDYLESGHPALLEGESGSRPSGFANCCASWAFRRLFPQSNLRPVNLLVLRINGICQTQLREFQMLKCSDSSLKEACAEIAQFHSAHTYTVFVVAARNNVMP